MRGYSITPSVELPLPAARPDLNAFQGESYTMLTIKHHRRVHREKLNSLSLSLSLSLFLHQQQLSCGLAHSPNDCQVLERQPVVVLWVLQAILGVARDVAA